MTRAIERQIKTYLREQGFNFRYTKLTDLEVLLGGLSEDQEHMLWRSSVVPEYRFRVEALPNTLKEATGLFSSDGPRYPLSMGWIVDLISRTGATSVLDLGCGAGLLLNYLQRTAPHLRLQGIEQLENLHGIACDLTGLDLVLGNYRCVDLPDRFDLLTCEFAHDFADYPPSETPHAVETCGSARFCPGCTEDMRVHIRGTMGTWRRWGTPGCHLALTGLLGNYPAFRALTLAARDAGWHLNLASTKVFTYQQRGLDPTHLWACHFTSDQADGVSDEDLAAWFTRMDPDPLPLPDAQGEQNT